MFKLHPQNKVGYDTTKDPTTNECYNKQFLSIKSGCNNERGGILFYVFLRFYYEKLDYSFHYGNTVYAFQIYMYSVSGVSGK